MGSALLNYPAEPAPPEPAPPAVDSDALRLEVAQRLADHRTRRRHPHAPPPQPAPAPSRLPAHAARIAAAVAERYANSPSYRAVLAAHAERAIQEAQAAAETAARNAEAIVQAQQQLLADLEAETRAAKLLEAPQPFLLEPAPDPLPAAVILSERSESKDPEAAHPSTTPRTVPPTQPSPGLAQTLTVRLYDGAIPTQSLLARTHPRQASKSPAPGEPDTRALDDEIAFRHTPIFEEPAGPPMPLPANLLEFPRQLIAPRKVRPRYAEGPLRDETAPADSQLRIFEVDAAHICTTPVAEDEPSSPQWTSLWLETSATAALASDSQTTPANDLAPGSRPHTAALSRRLIAASIDAAIVLAGLLVFSSAFAVVSSHGHMPNATDILQSLRSDPVDPAATHPALHIAAPLGLALAALCASFGVLYGIYQALFFWFSDATPGMRHARIALCTFADDNPTRPAMRRRLFAVVLSALPLGLGLLWALIDEDRLTWHDRLTRIYQRSY